MRVDIFCESGASYGLGHFYRSVKLASLCARMPHIHAIVLHNRGDFIPPPLESLLDSCMKDIECKNYEWLSTQPEMLDIAIVDSYEAQEWFYHRLAQHSKALICLDDTLRDVYPKQSYVINPTPSCAPYFKQGQYHLWCGEGYMILPPHLPPLESLPSQSVFVNFGGVDSSNLSQEFLTRLSCAPIQAYHFHLVLGGGYPYKIHIPPMLEKCVSVYENLEPIEFLRLASKCAYALSAGGGSMLELLILQIPSIILPTATNQHFHIAQWRKKGAICVASDMSHAIASLRAWQDTPPQILRDTLAGLSLGSQLEAAMRSLFENTYRAHCKDEAGGEGALHAIAFTELTPAQSHIVFSMRNHPQVAQWMYSKHITKESHKTFLTHLTEDHSRRYWLLQEGEQYIGVGSLTRINLTHHHAFVGIYKNIDSSLSHKGQKILRFLESYAFCELGLHTLHLEVLCHNTQAIAFYKKMGYTQEGVLRDFICRSEDGKTRYDDVILMYKERA